MLQRWKMSHNNSMVTEPDGEWVEYKDHLAAIAEKDRTVTKLRGKLVSKDRDIEQLYNTISLLDEEVARLKAELKAAYAINKWKEDGK